MSSWSEPMKRYYLETYGCQMNVHDSEKAASALAEAGYRATSDPAEADLILLNTCMVRERAAQKVFTRIGELKRQPRGAPVFGVMGCVAQAEAERLFERSREVRLVLGTQSIPRLPELLAQLEAGFPRAIDVRLTRDADFFELGAEARLTAHIAYLTIIEGCNKFCSFCIVPLTRGRERSRPAARILAEAQALAARGYQEVHLLGQNVNSYGLSGRYHGSLGDGRGAAEGELTFAGLLDWLARESRVPRLKFTTSHPRDFDAEVVRVMDAHDSLCPWIHLPAQSGSDRLLRAMRRGYTRREYMEKIAAIKRAGKDFAVTGDLIVGFPGETEADFRETLGLVAEAEYDGLYIFKYSPRPQTPAAAYPDSVPEAVKTERFLRLQELQSRIQQVRYSRYLGREVEVLVEGVSARSAADYTGHTRCHKVVNFPCQEEYLGKLVKVKIEQAHPHSLYGRRLAA
jgi:tRNA-2-methylthio-N6-dimethylallyladenosine synthase